MLLDYLRQLQLPLIVVLVKLDKGGECLKLVHVLALLQVLKLLLHSRSLIIILRDGEDETDQEISSLAELSLEFAVVLIKVVDPPYIILIQEALLPTLVIVLAILSDHGDVEIELLRSDEK